MNTPRMTGGFRVPKRGIVPNREVGEVEEVSGAVEEVGRYQGR